MISCAIENFLLLEFSMSLKPVSIACQFWPMASKTRKRATVVLLKVIPRKLAMSKASFPSCQLSRSRGINSAPPWLSPLFMFSSKATIPAGARGCSVSMHDLLALLLFTMSSQCPTECGHLDDCDSVCPNPFIPRHQGNLLGYTACQSDYLTGWRQGAMSEIFQRWLKAPLSAVRQK